MSGIGMCTGLLLRFPSPRTCVCVGDLWHLHKPKGNIRTARVPFLQPRAGAHLHFK